MEDRIHIVTGHFGSGKTEFAMNLALRFRKDHQKVSVVDLDIINMYFRLREQKEFLNSRGIEVIAGSINAPNLDIPALDAGILAPLENPQTQVILDVGGNPSGARALGRYRNILENAGARHYFIVNKNRPETDTAEKVIAFLRHTEAMSGIPVTDLVNATHMLKSTTVEDVLEGQKLTEEVSDLTGLPVTYIAAKEDVAALLPEEYQKLTLPIQLFFRESWMS